MAHFITLFFLSIGIHFGQIDSDYKSESAVQLKSRNMSSKYTSPTEAINASRRKLYSDNKGLIKIRPIGNDGWDGKDRVTLGG